MFTRDYQVLTVLILFELIINISAFIVAHGFLLSLFKYRHILFELNFDKKLSIPFEIEMYLCGVSDQIKQHRSQEDDQMVGVDTLIGKTLDQFENRRPASRRFLRSEREYTSDR